MPELPEVETVCQGLKPLLLQKTIIQVDIIEPRLRWPVPASLAQTLPGQKFCSLRRRGKYLLFNLCQGTMIGHLGMSGSFRTTKPGELRKKHDHVLITLNNNTQLRYHDPRRFGSIHWTQTDPLTHKLIQKLGPEPFDPLFCPDYLYAKLQKSKKPIKACLMDHHLVVGVGNIYATEALFLSRIHPQRPSNQVSLDECKKLCLHICSLLKKAIALGGTTLKDFVNADDKPGYFQQTLLAYGRKNHPCPHCQAPMESLQIAQRNSVFCPGCQQ